jgi:hypothetical protein
MLNTLDRSMPKCSVLQAGLQRELLKRLGVTATTADILVFPEPPTRKNEDEFLGEVTHAA